MLEERGRRGNRAEKNVAQHASGEQPAGHDQSQQSTRKSPASGVSAASRRELRSRAMANRLQMGQPVDLERQRVRSSQRTRQFVLRASRDPGKAPAPRLGKPRGKSEKDRTAAASSP